MLVEPVFDILPLIVEPVMVAEFVPVRKSPPPEPVVSLLELAMLFEIVEFVIVKDDGLEFG